MGIRFWTDVIRSADFRHLDQAVEAAQGRTGRRRSLLRLDVLWCALRYGAGFQDYRQFQFDLLTPGQRRTYLTRRGNDRLVQTMNPVELRSQLEDKGKFNRLFASYLHRSWLDLRCASETEFEAFCLENPVFVAKKARGKCGQDVYLIHTGEREDLYELLRQQEKVIVESYIHQHKALAGLYPGAVNTVRIVTLRGQQGPAILYASLRLGNGSYVDNLEAGGMCAPVNLTTGCVTRPASDKEGKIYRRHPVTGAPVAGFCLPYWQEAKQMVLEAAELVPELGYCGWDVCFLPDGPALIEGNAYPSHALSQLPAHQREGGLGILPEIWNLLQPERPGKDCRKACGLTAIL